MRQHEGVYVNVSLCKLWLRYSVCFIICRLVYSEFQSACFVMSLKRRKFMLSLKDKSDIIEAMSRGESGANMSRKYGVGTSTIADIKKNRENIIKFYKSWLTKGGPTTRKVMRKPKNVEVDNSVHTWFVEKRLAGETVTGPMLCAKALEFNTQLNGDPSFKASNGWLENFKIRCGIKPAGAEGGAFSANISSGSTSAEIFNMTAETERSGDPTVEVRN